MQKDKLFNYFVETRKKSLEICKRIEIEDYFNKKVFLKTWVKVKKNWNTDSDYLQSLGVGGSYD